jgi:hypothetical protein
MTHCLVNHHVTGHLVSVVGYDVSCDCSSCQLRNLCFHPLSLHSKHECWETHHELKLKEARFNIDKRAKYGFLIGKLSVLRVLIQPRVLEICNTFFHISISLLSMC